MKTLYCAVVTGSFAINGVLSVCVLAGVIHGSVQSPESAAIAAIGNFMVALVGIVALLVDDKA